MAKAKNLNPNLIRAIVQIIPADGWEAEYRYDHDQEGKVFKTRTSPLVCWAVVSEKQMLPKPGPDRIVGMIAGQKGVVTFADEEEEGLYEYKRSK
jgi:hypothetical protein